MMHFIINVILFLLPLFKVTFAETYYVTPTDSIPCPEEGVPCFTLSQYATKPNNYFASNTTLIMLPGNHSLNHELSLNSTLSILEHVAILTTEGNAITHTDVSVTCSQFARFVLNGISIVSMRGLVLTGCTNNKITSVEQFALENCSFQGQGHDGTGLELHFVSSANIVRSSFTSFTVTGYYGSGGAVYMEYSNVTINCTTFSCNTVVGYNGKGGAIYATFSSLNMNFGKFNNNTVIGYKGRGGAVCIFNSKVITTTMNNSTFNNNAVIGDDGRAGAMYAYLTNLNTNNMKFTNNTVVGVRPNGGAVYANSSSFAVNDSTFNNNAVIGDKGRGGAVYAHSSSFAVNVSTFNNNTVIGDRGYGGAVYMLSTNSKVIVTTMNNNAVIGDNGRAGALYAFLTNLNANNINFTNNTVVGVLPNGGAVYAHSSSFATNVSTFNNNTVIGDRGHGGAVYIFFTNSKVIVTTMNNSTFNNNTIIGNIGRGGAVYAYLTNLNMNGIKFTYNTVVGVSPSGGAVSAYSSSFAVNDSKFNGNAVIGDKGLGGAVLTVSSNTTTSNSTFNSNAVIGDNGKGGAVQAYLTNWNVNNIKLTNNTVVGVNPSGGAVNIDSCSFAINVGVFTNSTMTGNISVEYSQSIVNFSMGYGIGAAVNVYSSNGTLSNCAYTNNAINYGFGVLSAGSSNISLYGNTFTNNTATGDNVGAAALFFIFGNINLTSSTFTNNTVNGISGYGGAVFFYSSNITMSSISFKNNIVTGDDTLGGALYLKNVNLSSTGFLDILGNTADMGGALYGEHSNVYFLGNTTVSNNNGSLHVFSCNVTFMGNTYIVRNPGTTNSSQEGGAVTAIKSEVVFSGTVNLSYNTAVRGGAISALQSKLDVYGNVFIAQNIAYSSGGGIYAYQSEINLANYMSISSNTAYDRGGGIHALSSITTITDKSKALIASNYAKRGGGVCLELNAKFYIIKLYDECTSVDCLYLYKHGVTIVTNPEKWIRLNFTNNSADYGGAFYITDDTNSISCQSISFTDFDFSSECFIQGLTLHRFNKHWQNIILHLNTRNFYFTNNSASKAGGTIYGGLLDRCTSHTYAEYYQINKFSPATLNAASYILNVTNLNFQHFTDTTKISSDPVRVCFCRDSKPDCSYHPQTVYVKKGETFTVSLVTVDQVNNTISNSTIISYLSAEAGIGEGQSIQTTGEGCTFLNYSIVSPHSTEQLHLYANGTCKDIGISLQTINITFTTCPVGFKEIDSKCDCDPELAQYVYNCSIDTESVLRRSNVWIAFINNSKHNSIVAYPNCPFDYCYPPDKHIGINIPNDADKQCAFNRSGKLCGSCKDGLSLTLGSAHCMQCSNSWLSLLLLFFIAGIALVVLLLVCNFTVAAGTVNGLLFYANIVSSNQTTLLPDATNKFFAIFIAWLNLDLGFKTCFFNGLNGYWKTWLQLAFPAYIILLVVVIIKACEYSHQFARLIARKNPVAALATLVLLSYTKQLHMIISALQFAVLKYSDGTHEVVWLVDANIQFFEIKHVPLVITALVGLVLVLIFTFLLFFWQWLLLCPNRKPFKWIRNSRLHGVMDAYFITFNKNHRYWTGLLLLARALLYLVSALNGTSASDPRINLFATSCVVSSLILWKELTRGNIYKKWPLNLLDTSFLFNLLIFSIATYHVKEIGGNQTFVASTSVSIAFITFLLIVSYHLYTVATQNHIKMIDKFKILCKVWDTDSNSRERTVENTATENDDNDLTLNFSETVVDVNALKQELDTEINKDESVRNEGATTDNHSTDESDNTKLIEHQSSIELHDFAGDYHKNQKSNTMACTPMDEEKSIAPDFSDELAPLLLSEV